MRDICVDDDGYIYTAITTGSWDLPTTDSSWDPTYNDNQTDWPRGDIFVAKLDPAAKRITWSTYLGGPGVDEVYGIAVDRQGNVVLSGRASDHFPVTPGAFQTTFMGPSAGTGGPHGPGQDAFVAKFDAHGQLLWASYFGSSDGYDTGRDVAVDPNGDIYLAAHYIGSGTYPVAVSRAFLNRPLGGSDSVIAKIAGDGSRVLWARYLGGSGGAGENSVKVDPDGYPVFLAPDNSLDAFTTPGAYDRTSNGSFDWYIVKLTPDGKSFVYATYLGGSGSEGTETNSLAVDLLGRAVISGFTTSPDYPTTPDALSQTYSGGNNPSNWPGDVCISILSSYGTELVASTYYGGTGGDGEEGVAIDPQGFVYVAGGTFSSDLPLTPDAYQRNNRGDLDAFVAKFSPDLSQLLYASYLGGSKADYARCMAAGSNGHFAIGGQTTSSNFPTVDPLQTSLGDVLDTLIAKFSPIDPNTCRLQFSSAAYSIDEDEEHVAIEVVRTGSLNGIVSVNYATSDDTAVAGSDYVSTSGTLTWGAGDALPKTFNIIILDDTTAEGHETVELVLSNPNGAARLGSPSTAVLTINDNERIVPLLWTSLDDVGSIHSPTKGTGSSASINTVPPDDFVRAHDGNGIRINSPTEYVRFLQTDRTTKNVELNTGTVDFWYQPNYSHADGNRYPILSIGTWGSLGSLHISKNNASNGNEFSVDVFAGRFLEFRVPVTNYSWNAGDWINIRVAWDFTVPSGVQNIHAYLNDEEPSPSLVTTGPVSMPHESMSNYIYIGNRDTGSLHADGIIDEVRIYGVAMQSVPPLAWSADFNGDGRVDFIDFCTLAQSWLESESSVDIAPPPFGDDMVDFQDMDVLAESWLTATSMPPWLGRASNPRPANGEWGVDVKANLSWTAGLGAESHDVYFGVTNPGVFQGNQTDPTFDPGTMSFGATYCWRVRELNSRETTRTGITSVGD